MIALGALFASGAALCVGMIVGLSVPAMSVWRRGSCTITGVRNSSSSDPCDSIAVRIDDVDLREPVRGSHEYAAVLGWFGVNGSDPCRDVGGWAVGRHRSCWVNEDEAGVPTLGCYQSERPYFLNSVGAKSDYDVGLGCVCWVGGSGDGV